MSKLEDPYVVKAGGKYSRPWIVKGPGVALGFDSIIEARFFKDLFCSAYAAGYVAAEEARKAASETAMIAAVTRVLSSPAPAAIDAMANQEGGAE